MVVSVLVLADMGRDWRTGPRLPGLLNVVLIFFSFYAPASGQTVKAQQTDNRLSDRLALFISLAGSQDGLLLDPRLQRLWCLLLV